MVFERIVGCSIDGRLDGYWVALLEEGYVFCYRYKRKPGVATVERTFKRAMKRLDIGWSSITRIDYMLDVVTDRLVTCVHVTFERSDD